jgi:hypothetical protein
MTWGYNTEIYHSRYLIQKTLYENARHLLSDLAVRRRGAVKQRPIIFIAHSLGGLIVKSSLIQSNLALADPNDDTKSIKLSTTGILFFGTPHQGSRDNSWSRVLRNIVQFYFPASTLLDSVEEEAGWLEMQLSQYRTICSDFITYCFYESPFSESHASSSHPNVVSHTSDSCDF